jgi:hypothetical protein
MWKSDNRRVNLRVNLEHIKSGGYFSSLLCENLKITLENITILPVVSYGYEAWFLALIEAHRLRMFDKNVLRKIFRLRN